MMWQPLDINVLNNQPLSDLVANRSLQMLLLKDVMIKWQPYHYKI
jgi:hypothetical protein